MEHRKEIIALTDGPSKEKVSALIESKRDTVYGAKVWDSDFPSMFFDQKLGKWVCGTNWSFPPTISWEEFLEKYAQNTTTDDKPKRGDLVEVKTLGPDWVERIFLAEIEGADYPIFCVAKGHEEKFKRGEKFYVDNWKFMRPIPQFSLQAVDGVVTDPEQVVWWINAEKKIYSCPANHIDYDYPCYITKEAAETALKIGTIYLSLGDMDHGNGCYYISDTKADQLYNERTNGN